MKAEAKNRALMEKVQETVSRIASARNFGGEIIVDIPVICPSGSSAAVRVEANGNGYRVSDMGHGQIETELLAVQDFYASAAKKIAEEIGIDFDGNSMTLQTPSSRLESAIVWVANASSRAAFEAIRKAEETRETFVGATACKSAGGGGYASRRTGNEAVFDRLQDIFEPGHVEKQTIIRGEHDDWNAHNVVSFPGDSKAVFEFMSNHPNSVTNKFTKFSDLKSVKGISLNVVVDDLRKLDDRAKMIRDVAHIIPFNAPLDKFKEAAGIGKKVA